MAVLVDCAGGSVGGARRFRDELLAWTQRRRLSSVRMIGIDRRASAVHLAARELLPVRDRYSRAVAVNNIGFLASRCERWVVLGNALHFLWPDEESLLPPELAARVRRQSYVVRWTARRADRVVVPSSEMAERVRTHLPGLDSRILTALHPLSQRSTGDITPGLVICPVLAAPYKRLDHHFRVLEDAVDLLRTACGMTLDVRVTATRAEFAALGLRRLSALRPVGRLPMGQLDELVARAQVIYYPTTLESFGYPLAEARAHGRPVVGLDTARNREIAGRALVAYPKEAPDAVAEALRSALEGPPPTPDPAPFCPETYFRRLLF